MTIMFSDIRSFTRITETLSPEETFNLINEFLGRVAPAVHEAGGFVDKYIGDAVMALFPSPARGIDGALASLAKVTAFNADRDVSERLAIGIGLHAGPLTLGVVGSENRLNATVLGDSVNLASRIEALTRKYGVDLLVSGDLIAVFSEEELGRFHLREIDRVQVVGRTTPVDLFEVFEADPETTKSSKVTQGDAWQQMINAYRTGRFDEARARLREVQDDLVDDPVVITYAERLACLGDTPPAGWNGVTRLESKKG